MYDKQVRRRRAVLVVLVACCIVLLTVYFGESERGTLHATQRGAMEVLAPVQEGANRALKPFRDFFGWFGDTMDAKQQRDKLRKERDKLQQQVVKLELEQNENEQLRGLLSVRPHDELRARHGARLPALAEHVVLDRADQQGHRATGCGSTSPSSTTPGSSARSSRSATATPS